MAPSEQGDSIRGSGLVYQPGLDGVRALAVIAVLAYHDGRLRGGFLGVSTFFTLSGFLITGLLLAEQRARGRVSFRDFYAAPAAPLGARRLHRSAVGRRHHARAARAEHLARVPGRRAVGAVRRRQLAISRDRTLVRRAVHDAIAVAALLVARGRRAVLSRARSAARRSPRARARPAVARRCHGGWARGRVVRRRLDRGPRRHG